MTIPMWLPFVATICTCATLAFGNDASTDVPIQVKEISFEPLHEGDNRLVLRLYNQAHIPQTFAVHIQSNADGRGWGRPFFEVLPSREEVDQSFSFSIPAPVDEHTWIRLRYYAVKSREDYDYSDAFREDWFVGATPEQFLIATPGIDKEIRTALAALQRAVASGNPHDLWLLLDESIAGRLGLAGVGDLKLAMAGLLGVVLDGASQIEIQKVLATRNAALVFASDRFGQWRLDYRRSGPNWLLRNIVPPAEMDLSQLAVDRAARSMEHYRSEYFDIYYEVDSPASRDVDLIAADRDNGVQRIANWLGVDPALRLRIVLFRDATVKEMKTGHQGAGWAFARTIVEVYNDSTKLDPYHEATHILARELGDPPAALNEGLATYLSERLGSESLRLLGGGVQTLYQRVKQIYSGDEWIPLQELLTYTEIGSMESNPAVSYAEAGALVKYLVEQYGLSRVVDLYGRLANDSSSDAVVANFAVLKEVLGVSVEELEEGWINAFSR